MPISDIIILTILIVAAVFWLVFVFRLIFRISSSLCDVFICKSRYQFTPPVVPSKFRVGDIVRHKNRHEYLVIEVPDRWIKLEHCNEPFYLYEAIHLGTIWARCQSEFDDGRFTLIERHITIWDQLVALFITKKNIVALSGIAAVISTNWYIFTNDIRSTIIICIIIGLIALNYR